MLALDWIIGKYEMCNSQRPTCCVMFITFSTLSIFFEKRQVDSGAAAAAAAVVEVVVSGIFFQIMNFGQPILRTSYIWRTTCFGK